MDFNLKFHFDLLEMLQNYVNDKSVFFDIVWNKKIIRVKYFSIFRSIFQSSVLFFKIYPDRLKYNSLELNRVQFNSKLI